jgi:Ser/Thr protein kinase RdoA (MazF antagonist)
VELAGGRAHRVWRLETSSGVYVAKALNTFHTGDAERLGLIRDKVRLELAARDRGVRAPAPVVTGSGDVLAYLPGPTEEMRWWRVHEWVSGHHPDWSATSRENARWVGQTLAVIHDLATPRMGTTPGPPLIPLDQWRQLAARAELSGVAWAPLLAAGMDTIIAVTGYARQLFARDGRLLHSHAECDQRNVLVNDRPYLIDWDSLIYVNPMAELFAAAMNWAGANTGPPDLAIAAEVVGAYRRSARSAVQLADRAGYWLAWQLGWLWYSAHRALGDDVAPVDQRDRPAEDVAAKLTLLPMWLKNVGRWGAELSD